KRSDVFKVGQATRSNDRHRQGLCQLHRGFNVDTGQHAVAADVGVDDALDPIVFELFSEIDHFVPGELAPPVGGDLAILRVQSHDDVAAEGRAGVLEKTGVLHSCGADDHVAQTGIQIALDGVQITDASAQLNVHLRAHLLEDRSNRLLVLRFAGKGTVEIHQVHAPGPFVDPAPGHGRRAL